ncbi:DUF2490 domain-containing protein [Polaribacter sp.]|uniref:DUF2490 domain-containing protein n=1 Tax=Polaribacter sp. TaxID=1920175 RepID=UPI003EF4D112
MQKISLLLCFCLFYLNIQAQKAAKDQLGTWYMYNASHKISNKFALKTMAHFRYYEIASEFQQEIYRLGVNYTFNPKTNLTVGTSYSTGDLEYDASSVGLYEYRFYEDLNLKTTWGKFKASHRIRLEHRFIHKDITIDQTRNWVRYNLNVNYPLSKKWSAYIFNELFINLDRAKRFAQNWTGTGFLCKLNKNIKLKMGYFQIKSSTVVLKRLQLGAIIHTDFTKKTF